MNADSAPDKLIWIIQETLSDGSIAHNVEVDLGSLSAISESDARELAEKIRDAIEDHTVDHVGVMEQ